MYLYIHVHIQSDSVVVYIYVIIITVIENVFASIFKLIKFYLKTTLIICTVMQ